MKKIKRVKIHREGRNTIIGLTLVLFVVNIIALVYTAHWLFAILLVLSAALLVFVT